MTEDFSPHSILDEWLQELERQGKSIHTISAYRRAVQHFQNWNQTVIGVEFDPITIIPRDIRNWKTYQQKTEKARPATINQRLVGLAQFFQWALKKRLVEEDPTAGVHSLQLPVRQPKALSERNLRKLLRAAKQDPRDYAVIEILAGTGLRVGELLELRIGDLEIGERSGKVIIRQGKQGDYREVPLTKDVREALTTYLATHPDHENANAPLWLGTRGALRHRSSVLRILSQYAQRAGIKGLSPHALRHTFATRYLAANRDDLRGLARLLGHASLNTLMIYTEPNMDDLVERMEQMDH